MTTNADYFAAMYARSDDPWAFETRWYERRKVAMTMAALSRPRYAHAFDAGCANGILTEQLAARCDRLVAMDVATRAVELARVRLRPRMNVSVLQGQLPNDWPNGEYDLVVVSEIAYFLETPDVDRLIDCALASMRANGELLLCHWRPPISAAPSDAQRVHARFAARVSPRMSRQFQCVDRDFLLDVWSANDDWVAQREGLRSC